MPSSSPAQRRLMQGIANGWRPKRMKNPPSVAVAEEFVAADKKRRPKAGKGIGAAIGRSLDRRHG